MKHLSKQCKSIKQVDQYLKSIGLEDFCGFCSDVNGDFYPDYNSSSADIDTWLDSEETKGVSIQVTSDFEVLVMKYTNQDIEKLEKEVM